tara:strand:+ start:6810 stop:8606 length:1797 start_codon:yes stop_codon:yes gene_type:complete
MKYFFNKTSDSMFSKGQSRGAYDVNHKLFTFVVCVDNSDPLRLGRIRGVSPFGGGTTGSRKNDPTVADASRDENGNKVIPWSKDDPYLFNSLLPYNLNVIPMVKELFTAFSQQSPKTSLNKFYIGPIISHPSNVKMDKWTNALSITAAQKQNSRLGEPYLKGTPSSSGETSLVPEISKKGVFPNPEDIAIVGRYNTDIVLGMREYSLPDDNEGSEVQNWYPQILIRSGKFKKVVGSEVPDTNPKSTFVQLNTFPTTMERVEVDEPVSSSNDDYLRTMIVYHLDSSNLVDGAGLEWDNLTGWVAAYSMVSSVSGTTAGYDPGTVKSYMAGDYDLSQDVPGITISPPPASPDNYWVKYSFSGFDKKKVAKQIEKFISYVDEGDWDKLTKMLDSNATPPEKIKNLPKIFPLYFRPNRITLDMMDKNDIVASTPFFQAKKDVANFIKSNIELDGVTTEGYGLALTENSGKRDVTVESTTRKVFKVNSGLRGQQGIVSVGSEKIYLLSHASDYLGALNLKDNHYGVTQETYIADIDPKTNSIVRGEELIKLLEKMVDFMQNHCHAFPGLAPVPQAHGGTRIEDVSRLLLDAPKTILNKNIRIN